MPCHIESYDLLSNPFPLRLSPVVGDKYRLLPGLPCVWPERIFHFAGVTVAAPFGDEFIPTCQDRRKPHYPFLMKLHPLTPLLAPPLWAYSAGFAFGSLAAALGSEHPEVVTTSFRVAGFMLSFPILGVWMGKDEAVVNPTEYTSSDMRRALQEGREQERQLAEQTKYASELRTGSQKVNVGKRAYHFPAKINVDHLLALGEVVGQGLPPTDRALVPPFVRGNGETYQVFRDWMVYHAGEKPGDLAQFRTKRGDWDLTPLGTVMLYQWLRSFYSPTDTPPEVKKTLMSLSKAFRERTSKQNERTI